MKSNFQELEINNKIVNLLYKEWKTLFEESGFHTIQQVKIYYKKHRKSIRFFVLRDNDGNIIACYSFTVRSGNLYLCDVIVAPMYRKQGFSKILIQDACIRALNEGYSNIYLNATSSLVPFYEKYSFKVIS